MMISRHYRLKRNGNSAIFFSYVCNGKRIKALFASTLNRIAASVRCVSFMVVVLKAKMPRLVAAHGGKIPGEKRKSPRKVSLFASQNNILAVFSAHAVMSPLYTFQ